MTPRELSFLTAVIDSPEDDDTRLIYADWLEDQGDSARAEFIRLQCSLAGLDKADPQFEVTPQRCQELHTTVIHTWAQLMPAEIRRYCYRPSGHFERGFLTALHLRITQQDGEHFARHANLLFAHAPVQRLRLLPDWRIDWYSQQELVYTRTEDLRLFLEPPVLGKLASLQLSSPFEDINAVGRLLAQCAHLKEVREIRIRNRSFPFPAYEVPPDEPGVVEEIDSATKALLRATFGDNIRWDHE